MCTVQYIVAEHFNALRALRFCCSSTQSCAPSKRSLIVAVVLCQVVVQAHSSKEASQVRRLHGWAFAQEASSCS